MAHMSTFLRSFHGGPAPRRAEERRSCLSMVHLTFRVYEFRVSGLPNGSKYPIVKYLNFG